MKCIVIGSGFIGRAIVNNLLVRGDQVKILDFPKHDVLNYQNLVKEFKGYDEVYNLAGKLGTSELDHDIIPAINVNIIGAINVFNAAIDAGVPKVFYPSKPNVWLNTYTITKYASEQFANLYNQYGKVKISSLRLFNVYGEGQHVGPVRKIVPTFATQAINGTPLQIYGNGEQTVDMIYVEDAAELSVRLTRAGITEIIDGGRGISVTVNEVADDVNAHFDRKAVEHLPMRDGETPDTKLVADINKLRVYFPDFKFSDYLETLAKTLDYYAELDHKEALKFYGLDC